MRQRKNGSFLLSGRDFQRNQCHDLRVNLNRVAPVNAAELAGTDPDDLVDIVQSDAAHPFMELDQQADYDARSPMWA
jgi:hypothetical protein